MIGLISHVDHIRVESETEALLLESRLIKKFKPPFNIVSKDDTAPYYIHVSNEMWPRPFISHNSNKSLAGPFLNRRIPKRILISFRKICPYCTAPRPVGRPCLYAHLDLCSPCPGSGNEADLPLYLNNIRRLKKLLAGNFSFVKSQLQKEIKVCVIRLEYEKAAKIKSQLEALRFLENRPVSPEEYLVNPNLVQDTRKQAIDSLYMVLKPHFPSLKAIGRIEMFDIAHLAGTSATAAMTVVSGGEINPRLFRHFSIKYSQSNSDVDMMAEILSRRLKRADWPKPDLIVLDGGKSQLHAAGSILRSLNIPCMALAKRNESLYLSLGRDFKNILLPEDHPGLLLLMRLRDEAHRFSRRLHHLHRSRSFLT